MKEWKCLTLIIIIFIAACIETDIYLPAFTDMMAYFSISEEQVQSLLTWNFLGICLAGPFYGPLSDAIGRKKPLIAALSFFLGGSILTLIAQDFNIMLLGRILQGLGSGGCFTLGTAIIFDAFQRQKAMDAINKINSIIPFIMAFAPMLGGYLNNAYGFRSNFIAIAICVLFSLGICLIFFDETLDKQQRVPFQTKKILSNFKKVFLSIPFWQTTLIFSLLFAGYLAFLSVISVLFVLEFGVSKQFLPFFQAALLGAWLVANLLSKTCITIWGALKTKTISTLLVLLGGVGLLLVALLAPQNPYLLTSAMVSYTFGTCWILVLYFPEGMEIFPEIKGITASLLTSARLLITAVVVGIAGKLYDSTVYPLIGIVGGIIVLTVVTILFYEKNRKQVTANNDQILEIM